MINRWAAVFLLAFSTSASAVQWHGYQSEHILLFTDSDKNGEQEIADLQADRIALANLGLPTTSPSKPVTVILTIRQSEVHEAWPRNMVEEGTLGGLTYSYEDRIFLLVDMSRPDADRNLLHEYVHALVGERFVGLPRWLDEGIAEHYSTMVIKNGYASLGSFDSRRRWSQGICPQPGSFYKILSVEPNAFIAKWGSEAFYLPAAVIVRYLIEEFGIEKLYHMIAVFRDGTSIDKAMRMVYGKNVDEIEMESLAACRHGSATKERAAVAVSVVASKAVTNSDRSFAYMYAELLARINGHQDEAIRQFGELLRINRDDPIAKRGIGIALVYKKEFQKATPLLQEAWKNLPQDMTTLYHLLIACTNDSTCDPENYADDVKMLLKSHSYLGRVNEWIEAADRAEKQDDADSAYLPDDKPELVLKKK